MAAPSLKSLEKVREGNEPIKKVKKFFFSEGFTLWEAVLVVFSLCTFAADVGTDVIVIVQYAVDGHWEWAGLTLSFVIVSSVTVNFFSLRWHIEDAKEPKRTVGKHVWILNILQLGVVHRYWKLLRLGFEDRYDEEHRLIGQIRIEQCDICMLRLFDSFLESAPQLVLQLYIVTSTDVGTIWTIIAAWVSLVSLAWGVASYSKSLRDAAINKPHVSWLGVLLQTMWRGGTLTSRILAVVLCAAVLKSWFLLIAFIHWLAMTVWLILQKTDFCPARWEERIYNCIVGVIYCFCYFNVKENKSRFRVTAFYTLIFLENICFVLLNCYLDPTLNLWHISFPGSFFVVVGSFLIGIGSMSVYYCCCHPSGRIYMCAFLPFPHLKKILPTAPDFYAATELTNLRTLKYVHLHQKTETSKFYDLPAVESEPSVTSSFDATLQLRPLDVSYLPCTLSNHRSHSEDCLLPNHPSSSRKSKASHHHSVNYNFRSLAAHGRSFENSVHCSCLILYDDEHAMFMKNIYEFPAEC